MALLRFKALPQSYIASCSPPFRSCFKLPARICGNMHQFDTPGSMYVLKNQPRRQTLRALPGDAEVIDSSAKLRQQMPQQVASGEPLGSDNWDKTTVKLVSGATVVFLFLLVPQIAKNMGNMLDGNPAALAALSWVGYLTALLGNIMLLSYFLDRKENGGALVQAVGAGSNVIMLTQIYLADCMPPPVFFAVAALIAAATVISSLKLKGALASSVGSNAWGTWIDLLGLIGVSSLAQAVVSTFADTGSSLPGLLGLAAAGTVLILVSPAVLLRVTDKTKKLPESWHGVWQGVPAWSATLLFAFQPVAQLVSNFANPSSLAGLSTATVVLAMVGNGLMVPRALLTKDIVWLTGSAWAMTTGWAQLLSLFVNLSPSGARYLGLPAFAAATAVYLAYNAFILQQDLKAKGLPSKPVSLGQLLR